MKNIIYIFLSIAMIIAFAGCSNSTVEDTSAKLIAYNDMKNLTGYLWFQPEYDNYQPNAAFTDSITKYFNPAEHKIISFVSMTCSCTQPQLIFPEACKAIIQAGIIDSSLIIYSMNKANYSHPYQSVLKINYLPSIVIFKKGVPVFSVVDTINQYQIDYPGKNLIVDSLIYAGFKK